MIEAAHVGCADAFEHGVPTLAHSASHQPGAEHRKQGQRDDQRADQGEDHRVRHRLEQDARWAGEDVDREEADDDHDDRIEERTVDLRGRVANDAEHPVRTIVAFGEPAIDVFHHDHGGIDEDSEIDRANRKQVRRCVLQVEAGEGEQQRQGNRDRHDQSRAHIVQEEDEHHDHQQHAPEQVVLDRAYGLVDEVGAIVEGDDLYVLGQDAGVELLGLGLDAL